MQRLALWISAIVLFSLAVPRAASAADPQEALDLAAKIDAIQKGGEGNLAEEVGKVPEVYKGVEDKSARGKLVDALGSVAKDKDAAADARLAAVNALVAIEDPDPAWREISRLMPNVKVEEATDLDVAVVKAAGDLAQSHAIKPLEDLLGKAKDNKLSHEAAVALGGFGADKKNRVKILEDMVDLGRRIRPGTSTTKSVSKEAMDRWTAVGGGIVEGLNRLTGDKLATFEDWEAKVKEHKKKLQDLFPKES